MVWLSLLRASLHVRMIDFSTTLVYNAFRVFGVGGSLPHTSFFGEMPLGVSLFAFLKANLLVVECGNVREMEIK